MEALGLTNVQDQEWPMVKNNAALVLDLVTIIESVHPRSHYAGNVTSSSETDEDVVATETDRLELPRGHCSLFPSG